MTELEYAKWVRGLSDLSPLQLADLNKRLKLLGPTSIDDSFGSRFLGALKDVLLKLNGEIINPIRLAKGATFAKNKDKLAQLQVFIEATSQRRIVQDQILRIGLEKLYKDLVEWGEFAISSSTLISHLHRIPATLDKHFPGYAAAGMLEILVVRNA